MVILASMIACQALGEYKVMLGGALNVGVTPVEVKEIVYQAVPYVGMAKVYDFIVATNEILESRGIHCRWKGNPPPRRKRALKKGTPSKRPLWAIGLRRCTKIHRRIKSTFRNIYRRIVLAIMWPEAESTSKRGNF